MEGLVGRTGRVAFLDPFVCPRLAAVRSRGFGLGNFKELFLAIEREQEERGNL